MGDSFNVMCFAWNAEQLRMCQTTSTELAKQQQRWYKKDCQSADFLSNALDVMRSSNVGMVVFATEAEADSQTYFHAELLPKTMEANGYIGFGYKKFGGLRVSVYTLEQYYKMTKVSYQTYSLLSGFKEQANVIVTSVSNDIYGEFCFISLKMPEEQETAFGENSTELIYRSMLNITYKDFLAQILLTTLYNLDFDDKPDFMFFMGDFACNITDPNRRPAKLIKDASNGKFADLYKHDELKKMLGDEYVFREIKEGVNDKGPMFLPNWKMNPGRGVDCFSKKSKEISPTCYESHKKFYDGIGWHDRVLYKDNGSENYTLKCIEYDRLDSKIMNLIHHVAVYSVFSLVEKD